MSDKLNLLCRFQQASSYDSRVKVKRMENELHDGGSPTPQRGKSKLLIICVFIVVVAKQQLYDCVDKNKTR